MSQEENASAWKRHETKKAITDINKNPFERNRDNIAARNAAATASAADTKKIKEGAQKHFDATHRVSRTGRLMDPALAAASDKYHADWLARQNQPTTDVRVTSMLSLRAIIEFWQRKADSAVHFFESVFNYTSLVNCLTTRIFGRGRPAIPEEVSEAYFECLEGNHLELPRVVDANGATIRKRGQAQPIPPTLFPKFVWPQEEAAARDAELREAFAVMMGTSARRKAEEAAARKTPLAEQQKQVRSSYKPDAVPRDVIGSGVL
jgi:hypothetical protein